MKLISQVDLSQSPQNWSHSNTFTTLGSCFADEIGQRLANNLFPTTNNPLGTLYNPIALSRLIERALENHPFAEDEFFLHLELWRHFDIHSKYASPDQSEALERANQQLSTLAASLLKSDTLILTLGTAWSYYHPELKIHVGHNHKLPSESFEKRLLTVEESYQALSQSFEKLRIKLPNLNILLTVSPVRHLREGLHPNNLSKSTLLLTASQLTAHYDYVDYFPAFEILNDELRDYRYYESDLAHPNQLAVDYIWEKLKNHQFTLPTQKLCTEITSIQTALSHTPSHPQTKQHQAFLANLEQRLKKLTSQGLDTSQLPLPGAQ